MNDITIIGFTGFKRSGKDEAGNILKNNYGFKQIAFADALKNALKIIFSFTDEQLYTDKKECVDEYWNHSVREILQVVGTELFRKRLPELCSNISDDIWIKSVERQIIMLKNLGFNKFVITDVRFSNEVEWIKKLGGKIYRIDRYESDPSHESEKLIPHLDVDGIFVNKSSLKVFHASINEFASKL